MSMVLFQVVTECREPTAAQTVAGEAAVPAVFALG